MQLYAMSTRHQFHLEEGDLDPETLKVFRAKEFARTACGAMEIKDLEAYDVEAIGVNQVCANCTAATKERTVRNIPWGENQELKLKDRHHTPIPQSTPTLQSSNQRHKPHDPDIVWVLPEVLSGEELGAYHTGSCGVDVDARMVRLQTIKDRNRITDQVRVAQCAKCEQLRVAAEKDALDPDSFLQFDGELTYLVGWIGWGSVEEDLYQLEAASVEDAINLFVTACREGDFIGHGADNLNERRIWPETEEYILVYAMAELGQYRREPRWEKVK